MILRYRWGAGIVDRKMKIKKEIHSQLPQDYLFITGTTNIDCKYFIEKIEEGIKTSNANFKTYVKGFMTNYNYFKNDFNFLKALLPIFDLIDKDRPNWELADAWGIKEGFSHYTQEHNHRPLYLSGVIYLNKHNQKLIFPQINEEITPNVGKFVIFSGFLNHRTPRNTTKKNKYALSWNLR
jgi:hypothetical protein